MSEIFVSYARSTAKQAQAVTEALRGLGYTVWIDDDLPAHRAFSGVIEEQMAAAKAAVVIWSADAVLSEWVLSEANRAREDRKLVQVITDKTRLPMPFDTIQCADLSGWTGDTQAAGWRKVIDSVNTLIQARTPAPSAAAPARDVQPVDPLLAVLAFDNLSGDSEMTYFSDGVSEEILQTVARGAELRVIGRGSSFQFRGAQKGAAQVGAALKATHVLDGSVRRSGSKVRIAANLIECEHETTLWSDRFDRELSDVFALQDEIAAAVAEALKVAFAPAVKAETVNPAAYTLYLKALEIRNRGLLEASSSLSVIALLDEATALAPKFARAWVFLATMKADCLRFDEPDQPHAVTRAGVVEAGETALRLDPGLGAAHQALGQLLPFGQFAEREALHLKALAVAPNDPTVLTNASLFFAEVGLIGEALGYAKQAYDLDPMYPWAANWYVTMLEFAGRKKECFAHWAILRARWPDNPLIAWGVVCSAWSYREWAVLEDMVRAVREGGFNSPALQATIRDALVEQEGGPDVQARALKRRRDRMDRTGMLPLDNLVMLYRLGLKDEAFELADRASFAYMLDPDLRSPNGPGGPAGIFSPSFNGEMMADIRFVGLCAKLGLCDYWIKTDRWPDCAAVVAPHYDFKAEARRLAANSPR